MQNRFIQSSLARPLLTVLALTGAGLGACGAASSEDPAAAPAEGADSAPSGAAEGTPPSATTPPNASAPGAGENLFHAPQPWTKDVSGLPKSDKSDRIMGWLSDHGGWGTKKLRIEFSIKVLHVTSEVPFRAFTPTEDFYTPDCDHVPFPMPPGGALEDEQGYTCTTDGDCHLLVVHEPSQKLYEMWRANVDGGKFAGGCAAVWDLGKAYSPSGRGDQCTSADAGGFPISAMLFTADEVARGSIDHAIRFILPNNRIRRGVYVHPASHASTVTRGGPDAPPYGVRFRLRADYPLETLPTDGARVIARAMQRHGMLLADGGQVPLTAQDDRDSVHKWSEVGVDPDSVAQIGIPDLEVVDLGDPIPATGDCVRQ
jgi:serine/threonine-protein kinase